MSDKETIDHLLNDDKFIKIVEKDIGFVKKVTVDWGNNTIDFFGTKQSKRLKIDETLAVLRKQIQ